MELRDVVGILVGLDDERRALTNDLTRTLDPLERAVVSDQRLGIQARSITRLRDGIAQGSAESIQLTDLSEAIAQGILAWARLEAEKTALVAQRDDKNLSRELDAAVGRLTPPLHRARIAWEAIGRLRQLLDHRTDVDTRLRRLRSELPRDAETTELLEVLLASRALASRPEDRDAAALLAQAESAATADGQLAGMAANARALRDALGSGKDPSRIASDLVRRIVGASLKIARERDEQRRHLSALERETERRQAIAHGLFQAATKASEVLEQVAALRRLARDQMTRSGALGALKAACLEHGIVSMMLGLKELRLDRSGFDNALSELSGCLGTLLALLEDRPSLVDRIVPAWDDLATVDARTMEPEWQAALWDVVGLSQDRQGVLSVAPERLARLAVADSLEPWRRSLLARIDDKTEEVHRATRRLEGLDLILTDLVDEGGERATAAIAVKASLARFVGEALHLMSECHDRIRDRLLDEKSGFALVAHRISPFHHLEDLAAEASEEERRAAVDATLGEVSDVFAKLESSVAGESGSEAARWKETETRIAEETSASHRRLAAALARARRLRAIALPPMPRAVDDAIAMAASLRAGESGVPGDVPLRDHIGEALEALHVEREFHSLLALPSGADVPALRSLGGERNRRLLDLRGASVVLLLRLLQVLCAQHEGLTEADQPAQLSWIEELLEHAAHEMDAYMQLLDHVLLDLSGNAERLERHAIAFDAYHAWARSISEGELGMDLVATHGARFFERFEEPLGRLGTSVIEGIAPESADWRVSGELESVMELQAGLLARIASRPTLTDLAGRISDLRERTQRLRDDVVARAEAADPFARGGGGRLGG